MIPSRHAMTDIDSGARLRELVEEAIGPISDSLWREACGDDWHPPYDSSDVEEAVRTVQRLRDVAAATQRNPNDSHKAKAVLRQLGLEQRIESLRLRLFGSAEVPFASAEQAVAWIRETVRDETGIELASGLTGQALEFAWHPLGKSVTIPDSRPDLYYPTNARGTLSEIAVFAARFAGQLQCSRGQVSRLVLLGEIPETPPISVRVFFGSHPGVRSLVITIRSPEITTEELSSRYTKLRETVWGAARAPRATERDLRLLDLRESLPSASVRDLHREWNSRYPGDAITTSTAFSRCLNRAMKRVWRTGSA